MVEAALGTGRKIIQRDAGGGGDGGERAQREVGTLRRAMEGDAAGPRRLSGGDIAEASAPTQPRISRRTSGA